MAVSPTFVVKQSNNVTPNLDDQTVRLGRPDASPPSRRDPRDAAAHVCDGLRPGLSPLPAAT
jgi:hypothetical protein